MNDPTSVFVKPIHLFLLVLIGIVPFFHPAHAETEQVAGKVLFILDASGSMWGRVEGKEKIVVAKEVMTNLVKELPEQIEVGLQAYGHRSKGDCNDIEVLVPVGGDKENVIQAIQSINPKGKTPITRSFEAAGEKLKGVEEQTTVILISDGKETCGGDPCTLVKSLRQRGIHVRVHVVGFDVNKKEREQLVCIADAGGGKYFTADNAEQLTVALTEVKREIVAAPKVEESEPPKKRVVKMKMGVGTISVNNTNDTVRVVNPETGKKLGQWLVNPGNVHKRVSRTFVRKYTLRIYGLTMSLLRIYSPYRITLSHAIGLMCSSNLRSIPLPSGSHSRTTRLISFACQ